ncbi:MAG: SPOR domain-containing protein [Ignavibacteriae bacterium]|nr:SPOR domain-containing protein [Ignavibacteriota bacterium]
MNRFLVAIIGLLIIALSFIGCSSSEETQSEKEATDKQVQQEQAQELPPPPPSDTIEAVANEVQQETQQLNQTQTTTQEVTGTYAVQVGAFKVTETADQIASLARSRFSMQVKSIFDKETGLTKVLVGGFATKDEARAFRDQLARQFPEDYKDAWVTELPRE